VTLARHEKGAPTLKKRAMTDTERNRRYRRRKTAPARGRASAWVVTWGHGGARDPGLSVAVSRPRNQRPARSVPPDSATPSRVLRALGFTTSPAEGFFFVPARHRACPGCGGRGWVRAANRRSPHRSSTMKHSTARSLALPGRAPPLPASPPWRRPLSPLVVKARRPVTDTLAIGLDSR